MWLGSGFGFVVSAGRALQPEMIAQRLSLYSPVPIKAAALQFGNDEIDEIVEPAGQNRRLDDEAVRGARS